jgi:predicted GNAT family acetyltransferase
MDDITVSDNSDAHRFELRKGGVVAAYSEYNLLTGMLMFTHTEVLPQFEGQGFGSKLARFALEEVRRRGLNAVPVCPFIAGYIRKHAEFRDLVSETHRRAYDV